MSKRVKLFKEISKMNNKKKTFNKMINIFNHKIIHKDKAFKNKFIMKNSNMNKILKKVKKMKIAPFSKKIKTIIFHKRNITKIMKKIKANFILILFQKVYNNCRRLTTMSKFKLRILRNKRNKFNNQILKD